MSIPAIRRTIRAAATLALGLVAATLASAQAPAVAPIPPVTTDYFGTPVVDNYRYMEDLGSPEVRAWMKNAPRFRLLATSLAHPDLARASIVIPEGRAVLTNFSLAKDGI